MHEKMSRMFENMTDLDFSSGFNNLPVDLKETDDKLIATADMPGVNKENIKVRVREQTLSISAQGDKEVKEEGKGYIRVERSSKSYSRSIPLPTSVVSGSAKAKYENGVLTVEMDKKEKSTDYNVEVE